MGNIFKELGLKEELIQGLEAQGINTPTKIQEQAIPEILLNHDIIGESETGSGKTLAYLLPLFQKVNWDKREMQAIILAPTHELAIQVNNQIKELAKNSGLPVTSAVIVGNVNIKRQIETLKKDKPHIIVGSTGRILELIKMKTIKASQVQTIIIDEADRLLDQNNISNIQDIIKTTLKERQLIFFSATIGDKTINLAKGLMKDNYKIIRVAKKMQVNPNINHVAFLAETRDKIVILRKIMNILKPEKAIAFLNKPFEIIKTLERLQFHGIKVEAIYGEAEKEERRDALNRFRLGKANLLVASDIAARGLDIKDVSHIISMDLPEDPQSYLHRAGRTARAGEKGMSISIVTDQERDIIKKYEQALGIKIELKSSIDQIVENKQGKRNNKT